MKNTADVRVERLVYGGDALGKLPDGRTVFFPFAIPAEHVRLRLVEEKPRFLRAEVVQVLEASPERVQPRCVHFGYCGGCHYQHMSYSAQVEAKVAILREQLERIGGLTDIPGRETLAAPEPWYYRNQIQFHLTREGKLGFQRARTNQTFAIRECHLPQSAINQAWPQLTIEPTAAVERISLRQGMGEDLLLILEGSPDHPLEFSIEGLAISILHKADDGNIVLAGSDHIFMEVAGRQFRVTGSAFFQVHIRQADAMVHRLMKALPADDKMTILDVYCGVGLFSAFLAPRVKKLVGIELSPEACADYVYNLDEFDNVSLYEAAAVDVLQSVDFKPDAIIVDPPREGLGGKVVDGILKQDAPLLAYFSCDPATLARDAKLLVAGGYRLEKLALLDMFPQTYHVESIVLMSRDDG